MCRHPICTINLICIFKNHQTKKIVEKKEMGIKRDMCHAEMNHEHWTQFVISRKAGVNLQFRELRTNL